MSFIWALSELSLTNHLPVCLLCFHGHPQKLTGPPRCHRNYQSSPHPYQLILSNGWMHGCLWMFLACSNSHFCHGDHLHTHTHTHTHTDTHTHKSKCLPGLASPVRVGWAAHLASPFPSLTGDATPHTQTLSETLFHEGDWKLSYPGRWVRVVSICANWSANLYWPKYKLL